MGVETKTFINANVSRDTGVVSMETKIVTTDKRPIKLDLTTDDAIRVRENKIALEKLKFFVFSGGVVAGLLGGITLIITGFENLNQEQVGIGAGAIVLGKYFWGSAKKHIFEANVAGNERNEVKRKRKQL